MGARTTARTRRYAAVLACFLWLLGVEVLPNVHLAAHDESAPHTHAANGMVVTVSFERDASTHRHDDGSVHADHDAASAPAKKAPADNSITAPLDAHVAGGLAHRAVALLDAPLPIVDVPRIDLVVTDLVAMAAGRSSLAHVSPAVARGPPAA